MTHFAKISNGKVIEIIVAEPSFFDTFIDTTPGQWIEISTPVGIGYGYDTESGVFIPPQKYASWTLDEENFVWVAPTPKPNDGDFYVWDEETTSWIGDTN